MIKNELFQKLWGKTNCLVDVSALELLFNIEANSANEKTMNYFCIGICLCYSYTNYTGSPESEKKMNCNIHILHSKFY